MIAYEIRAALPTDEDQLFEVARHLNTVNLPHDRGAIQELLHVSEESFSHKLPVNRREYVFVLRDLVNDRVIGTSMILAQLGRRDAPYIYVDVIEEEKYSATIDRHFHHTLLRIGYSYNGPTEIGGLVLHPDYRRVPERLGQSLSYIRFLFLATHRALFRPEVVAELLPPLLPDGTSHLWEALGRRFTGLSYAEADVLSKKNKEFIRQLFPESVIHASLLSPQAQEVIGKVGSQTRGVEKMLRRIGFQYAHRVDPFDGGPHFAANTDDITLVMQSRRSHDVQIRPDDQIKTRGLIAVESPEAPFFVAVLGGLEHPPHQGAVIGHEAAEHLGVTPSREVLTLPLD
jgi:arginine N-succinyltransferase